MFLLNETYISECKLCPVLSNLLNQDVIKGEFRDVIARQYEEELNHIRQYHPLVGVERLTGTGYHVEIFKLIESLPNATLKLFLFQGIVEGFALAAFLYRREVWENSPSWKTDESALKDEYNHVQYSYKFFHQLIKAEGIIDRKAFVSAARDANIIFKKYSTGEQMAKFFRKNFSLEVNPAEIEKSAGTIHSRELNIKTLIGNKSAFISNYYGVAQDAYSIR